MDPITQSIATALGGSGVLGVVVWILLKEINPKLHEIAKGLYERMRALECAHDRNAEATALRLIATPHILPEIKERASQLIEQVKAAEEERKARQ